MEINTVLYLGISLLIIYGVKRTVEKLNIPAVTGYVIIGVIAGTSLLKFFNKDILADFSIVSDLALAIIAFTIGVELNRTTIKKLGSSIIIIAFCEGLFAFIMVSITMYLIDPSLLYQAIILGSIASATAPAATVYVIHQYRSKGPLTSTILGVVGIDDAIALTIYVFASLFAQSIILQTHLSLAKLIITPVIKIALSILVGAIIAFAYILFFKHVRFHDDLLIGTGAAILIAMGVADLLELSELLTVMALGSVLVNSNSMLANRSHRAIESFSPVLLPLFFMFAGAHLNIMLIGKIGITGLIYTASRFAGKIGGATVGATISRAPRVVRKYIGFSLLPQVGVAIALSLAVQKSFGRGEFGQPGMDLAQTVINLLLFTTIITEIIGPILTRHTLTKSGEINMKE